MTPFWDNALVPLWVEAHLPDVLTSFRACQAMGVEHDGDMIAGFVFHNWDPKSGTMELSGASTSPRWATRGVIRAAMEYVFDTCGCQMLYAKQRLENRAARDGLLKLGGLEVIVPRMFGRDEHGSITTLTDDQWRSSRFGER